jgi:hypothetical protein
MSLCPASLNGASPPGRLADSTDPPDFLGNAHALWPDRQPGIYLSKNAVGPQHRGHAEQHGKPAKYEHYLILVRLPLTATLILNGR